MLGPGDSILATVSGGPDSVFMLLTLVSLKCKLKLGDIAVCNIDHGLRGDESKEDSAFVRKLAHKLGLKIFHKTINLSPAGSTKLSTEERAREARYKFFKEAATAAGAKVIATGHTLDDQAETVLMRIIKGSSLKGIVGIAPVREEGDLRFIRPLIEIEKDEIVRYLDTNSTPYRIDRTNLEPIYFRNIVRRQIIPFLEKYNPRLKRALFSLAEHLREDFEFIEDEKKKAGREMGPSESGMTEVALKDIVVQSRAIQKEILRDMLESSGGEVKKLSFRHWKEMDRLLRSREKGISVDLPGGIRVTKGEKLLTFRAI